MQPDLLFNKITQELNASSDRGVAVLGGSIVEALARELVLHIAISDKTFDKDIERTPLKYMSTMLYCMGMIPSDLRHDMNSIYSVRDAYAHRIESMDFESKPISGYVDNLIAPKRFGKIRGNKIALASGGVAQILRDLPRRIQFISAVAACSATLEHLKNEIPKVSPSHRYYVDPSSDTGA